MEEKIEEKVTVYFNNGDAIMLNPNMDSCIVFKGNGGIDLHLAIPENKDDPEAITPTTVITVTKIVNGIQDIRVLRLIDEIFDEIINSTEEDREVEKFVNEETSNEGC
jgi:hypothetical protein